MANMLLLNNLGMREWLSLCLGDVKKFCACVFSFPCLYTIWKQKNAPTVNSKDQ